ncbi:ATP-binding protein [Dyadobacter chenwenxiniae]|uniref:histidine kinase n=1 Tax=Dyadobacter chenwenxiniae TaxID=2906456 RepID=A0A9X1PPX7_9BACT|nr:ATP-binding protein [Dyadobacter chenwenxiniae]MCF0064771.1 ATP-binding protein [Dyadobacter chenwenxiniae]UON84174.1 ATP-binding protein [Dyadobacter chenwenxiniae]
MSLTKSAWKFHSGDDTRWASPNFADSSWQTLSATDFGKGKYTRSSAPKSWTGFGWFRLWVKKESPDLTNSWGLKLNHDAASETYLDGKKIMSFGRLGNSKQTMQAVREPNVAIPLAITDTLPHLIAIRFSNFEAFYPNFIGFDAQIQDLHQMNRRLTADQRFMDQLLMSVAAACTLVLLHLLLFAFYPKQRIHLCYVFYVSMIALGLYARYETIVTTDPAMQVFYTKVFLCFVSMNLAFGALLLYSAGYSTLPRKKIIAVFAISIPVTFLAVWNWYDLWYDKILSNLHNLYLLLFILVFYTDAFLAVLREMRKGRKTLWLIAAGVIFHFVSGILIGANVFNWFTLPEVMLAFAWGNLVVPALFTIYLALEVAGTNRFLAKQLIETRDLAAANLAQEQEKQRLILAHTTELEETVLKRTAQVREQADRLQEMDAAKSRFFINLTHEFKTPLSLIINPARELLNNPDPKVAQQYAGYILQNSNRLLQLINQLLDLGRLESGQIELEVKPVDIVAMIRIHVAQFHSLATNQNIRLDFFTETETLVIEEDADKLEKIIQNLISNAIKFSHKEGQVTVLFKLLAGEQFEIRVEDQGIGIPQAKLPFIFDRFYQADSSDTRTREGAGIGLALVKELVTLLGGTITVESSESNGSVFAVRLPYRLSENEAELTPYPEPRVPYVNGSQEVAGQLSAGSLPVILLIEDNQQLNEFIRTTLSEKYSVLTAEDGQAGIDLALAEIPALIITDLMMPVKNGYEVCAELKADERSSHIPIVMLTAKADQDSRIHGLETGADAYLGKPFDNKELQAVIENLLRQRKALQEKYSQNYRWLTHSEEMPSVEKAFLDKIRTVIEQNLDDEQISTDWVGRQVGLSRAQLHRKLKALINQSPGEFVRSIRMQKAHELLGNKAGTIAEISYMVGYGNPANFSTSFSKHFGYPPSSVSIEKQ